MKILVFDNYDSFTYNLVHIIKELGYGDELEVYRNDKITLEEVAKYDKILLSPGPGIPEEAGIMHDLIREYGPTKSILGVCLGHQGISEIYGATLTNMDTVLHGIGIPTNIAEPTDYLFEGIPSQVTTGRYHSWVVDEDSIQAPLQITAMSEDGLVMAIKHKEYDVRGVQFHPESVLTDNGIKMMENWLKH